MVVLINTHAVTDAERSVLCVDGGAGIAFFIGIIPVGLIAKELKVQLPSLHLCFLQAEKVGVKFRENIGKTFACNGPEAVYVPGDEFQHTIPGSRWRLPWCPLR